MLTTHDQIPVATRGDSRPHVRARAREPDPPVDVMRHDRYGEPIDDDVDVQADHDPRCRGGWLPDTPDGLAVPCLTCRPHLATRHDHLHRQLNGPRP